VQARQLFGCSGVVPPTHRVPPFGFSPIRGIACSGLVGTIASNFDHGVHLVLGCLGPARMLPSFTFSSSRWPPTRSRLFADFSNPPLRCAVLWSVSRPGPPSSHPTSEDVGHPFGPLSPLPLPWVGVATSSRVFAAPGVVLPGASVAPRRVTTMVLLDAPLDFPLTPVGTGVGSHRLQCPGLPSSLPQRAVACC
jgi:hypothetical protein